MVFVVGVYLFQMILRMLDNCTIQPDEVCPVCWLAGWLVRLFALCITQDQVF